MVKVITFLKRKGGMPVEEFQSYWRNRHPEVVTRLPGVRRYLQSHALLSDYAHGDPIYDGIAEVWADDTAALRGMTQSPAHPALQADEARFIDRASMGVIITEDHVIKDGAVPPDAVKRVTFLTRKPGLSVEAFQRHWLTVHGPIAAALPGLRRHVQSHTRPSAYGAGRVPAYDGVVLTWFDSTEAIRDAAAAPEYARVLADAGNFLVPGQEPSIVTREHVIVA
ncbi:MAG: EthD family reductase [Candidatus Rokubacteria bacterium]|nr:EthD family reductase [Candidatus Rokubacteria bacterium]